MYRTCVQNSQCIRDSSAVPINHSTILGERLTRCVSSTTEYSPVHGCPYVCMIPLTTGFLSWCFHYTAAIHNGEVCGYNWGIFHDRLVLVFAFPCQLQPPCTFTTALCVANTQHCRCEIQYSTGPMATALHPMCDHTLSPA